MDDDCDETLPQERSAVAQEIEKLRDKVLSLTENRERLPQPLFWSLFNSRIKEIKRQKEIERTLKEVLES